VAEDLVTRVTNLNDIALSVNAPRRAIYLNYSVPLGGYASYPFIAACCRIRYNPLKNTLKRVSALYTHNLASWKNKPTTGAWRLVRLTPRQDQERRSDRNGEAKPYGDDDEVSHLATSEYAGIFTHQLGADLQADSPYAAVPVGGEEEVHGRLQMKAHRQNNPWRWADLRVGVSLSADVTTEMAG
jgi:hypothetical protein